MKLHMTCLFGMVCLGLDIIVFDAYRLLSLFLDGKNREFSSCIKCIILERHRVC
jgi:hypothetical protein